ncbi:MAG TPA: 1-deoxy-D-xylulose-5-phosphate reductoisomerase [Candidatus Borkfalkia avistercoris]|uniref:1-deoxy-D-xylulose 5-phosphate reductoisomerase n=1 Tax=Candidatus Borkfalkia avistercoris TaxID=2838504 RepID=A0A9D2CZR5_9FIRM|nr:1-deoxy-D-xylulose-5-phosphate reductoisomerase [Candidatus Borkfalkia avistercoris]
MRKKIALIGSTGSIGRQVINVCERYPDLFQLVAIAANTGGGLFFEQAEKLRPAFAALRAEGETPAGIPAHTRFARGEEAFEEACGYPDADVVFIAVTGFAGLKAALTAIKAKKDIALANKESLVAGGSLVMPAAERAGVRIIPVDSEHSALWQCLAFDRGAPFSKLILTASGGALRDVPLEKLSDMAAKDALAHPNWDMGAKITIDCATMLNKGFEVIEAMHLYNAPLEKIEVVMHRESIVHSMVAFADGAVLAQMSYPSMELPIQLALTYPERLPSNAAPLDLVKLSALHFSAPDPARYPCFFLALKCAERGGDMPCALNAAGEVAVQAFLHGQIKFTQIAEIIEETLGRISPRAAESYALLEDTDANARRIARSMLP